MSNEPVLVLRELIAPDELPLISDAICADELIVPSGNEPIDSVPSIFKVPALASHTSLSPKLKSPAVAAEPPWTKNGVFEFPCVPVPEYILSDAIVIPPISPLVAVILPVKNTFSLNNPKPGFEPTNVLDNPVKSPSLAFKSIS